MALGEHYTPEWTALRKAASMSVSVRSRRVSMSAMFSFTVEADVSLKPNGHRDQPNGMVGGKCARP